MAEALLDTYVWFKELTEEQRVAMREWAEKEGVPLTRTFGLLFGEGRVTVFSYSEPLRWNPERTGAAESEPELYHVRTVPPIDVLKHLTQRQEMSRSERGDDA